MTGLGSHAPRRNMVDSKLGLGLSLTQRLLNGPVKSPNRARVCNAKSFGNSVHVLFRQGTNGGVLLFCDQVGHGSDARRLSTRIIELEALVQLAVDQVLEQTRRGPDDRNEGFGPLRSHQVVGISCRRECSHAGRETSLLARLLRRAHGSLTGYVAVEQQG